MDHRTEVREFLTSRRARISPEQSGLATYGSRRVPGLRREEVAVLAGVSVPYYTRLERGDINGVSDSVLNALAGALQLDDAERAHLFDLARAAQPAGALPRRRRRPRGKVAADVQQILDAMTGAAAFMRNDRLDVLAGNPLGYALYCEVFESPIQPPNTIRVGELSTQSDEFRIRWAAHHVRFHLSGTKHFHHPIVGDINLNFNRLDLAADPGLTIFTYTAEPGSRDEETLKLLGSWAATTDTLPANQAGR